MLSALLVRTSLLALGTWLALQGTAAAQKVRAVWDLPVGEHATQLPKDQFIDFACGTNGGPPSIVIADWSEFQRCRAESGTGLHEVYFRYDDEAELRRRARFPETTTVMVDKSTSAYDVPIIVSALFDREGFLVGYRIVSDPRVDLAVRELGSSLAGPLRARYGEERFACVNLPPAEGETPFQGVFLKRQCRQSDAATGIELFLEARALRKRGQVAVQAQEGPTEGQFESVTYFQALLSQPIADHDRKLANLPRPGPSPKDELVQRARDCAGCDLRGVDLKRANLAGANLAGADLSGANLHGAILAGASLAGAKLDRANLNRADIKRAKLGGAILSGAMLYEARLDAADLTGANLERALGARVQLIGANLTNANLLLADLRGGRLNDVNFTGAELSGTTLDDAQLSRSVLTETKLLEASLLRATMVGVDLKSADVRAADLFGANLRDADLSSADFSYARLTSANLTTAKTTGAKFLQTQLPAGFRP
jgi:uncharacterized protein YjbI with pentapeptide repeats